MNETNAPDGGIARFYDTDGDGRADFAEHVGRGGLIDVIRFDPRGNGSFDDIVDRLRLRPDECRDLVIILDSVPFDLVKELRDAGRFRHFHPPARVIAPFPAMTDLSLAEFFGVSPCPGVEAEHYDGQRLTDGFSGYANEVDTPWVPCTDYRMAPINHLIAYFYPNGWFGHELRGIQTEFLSGAKRTYVAYCVSPSALGTLEARNGHHAGLTRVDRFCQYVMQQTRGRARITLLSDHGHHFQHGRRVRLSERLDALGYRATTRLDKPGDVVVVEFGMVSSAVVHTRRPAAVARDCLGIDGVELSAYHDDGANEVVVLSRDGRARIARVGDRFRYEPEFGDPLRLLPILSGLGGQTVPDGALFEATRRHIYPDAVYRLWRAFHGLVRHRPDVLLSLGDGWYCGSTTMETLYHAEGIHGSLNLDSSSGFCMTTAAELPDVVRMADLRAVLCGVGVDLSGRGKPLAPTASRFSEPRISEPRISEPRISEPRP